MKVVMSWDGDHIGRKVAQASYADNQEELRRISSAINTGNNLFRSWVEMGGGSIISFGGDEGRAEIEASKLEELPRIRAQYAQATGSPASVGVGVKLSEADKALMVAKFRGGDQITLYGPELEQEIEQATAKTQNRSETDKLSEVYLDKAEPGQVPVPAPLSPPVAEIDRQARSAPALNAPTGGAGIKGPMRPAAPAVDKPKAEASEHSEGEAAASVMENGPRPAEMTHAGKDLEDQFHDLAQDQHEQDQSEPVPGSNHDELKAGIVRILQQIRSQGPVLEQIRGSAPEVYEAVMALTQGVIAMARELRGDNGGGLHVSELDARAQVKAPAKSAEPEKKPAPAEKAEIPSARHHLNLPVGSQIDSAAQGTQDVGKIKVQHGDGKTGWVQARAGQILSEDGHAISSRNPGGR